MTEYVAAIDQGTTSTRCMVFDHSAHVVSVHQLEHEQIFPRAGWVEHDAEEIWSNTREVTAAALAKADLSPRDIAAVGITNQRETALVWERATGKPVHHAIVWQDTRTDRICERLGDLGGGADRYKDRVGLPLATYFSGPKVMWILENVEGAREMAERGDAAVRHHGHLAAVEHDRRSRRRPAPHRRDQCVPHHADGPRHAAVGPRHRLRHGDPALDAAADPVVVARCTPPAARAGSCPVSASPATSATSRRRRSARSASMSGRRRTPTAPETSCFSTPAPSGYAARTGC